MKSSIIALSVLGSFAAAQNGLWGGSGGGYGGFGAGAADCAVSFPASTQPV